MTNRIASLPAAIACLVFAGFAVSACASPEYNPQRDQRLAEAILDAPALGISVRNRGRLRCPMRPISSAEFELSPAGGHAALVVQCDRRDPAADEYRVTVIDLETDETNSFVFPVFSSSLPLFFGENGSVIVPGYDGRLADADPRSHIRLAVWQRPFAAEPVFSVIRSDAGPGLVPPHRTVSPSGNRLLVQWPAMDDTRYGFPLRLYALDDGRATLLREWRYGDLDFLSYETFFAIKDSAWIDDRYIVLDATDVYSEAAGNPSRGGGRVILDLDTGQSVSLPQFGFVSSALRPLGTDRFDAIEGVRNSGPIGEIESNGTVLFHGLFHAMIREYPDGPASQIYLRRADDGSLIGAFDPGLSYDEFWFDLRENPFSGFDVSGFQDRLFVLRFGRWIEIYQASTFEPVGVIDLQRAGLPVMQAIRASESSNEIVLIGGRNWAVIRPEPD
jgi:hypothetical protein